MNLRVFIFTLTLLALSSPAFAYIDPGMGSIWVQTMIAFAAGLGMTFKMYWQKIKLMFFKKNKTTDSQASL